MFRKRNIIIVAWLILTTFLLTTVYLLDILNDTESEVRIRTIEEEILAHLPHVPNRYKASWVAENNVTNTFINAVNSQKYIKQIVNYSEVWLWANEAITKTQLYDLTSPNLGAILAALRDARIVKADLDARGTQLKFLLTLEGNQQVVFKPKWYEKQRVIEGPVYAGKDRFAAEIIAFYLSAILNKPLTPLSTHRTIYLKRDILPVGTQRLLATSFERKNQTCLYGKCFYCKREDPICDSNQLLTGAVIFNVKAKFKNYRSPWQRTYHKTRKAPWEESKDYCRFVKEKLTKKRLYDLIDTAIFDFLLQNGDRHHYETLGESVVWLDNGKGLGNPFVNHIDILAPLYQCCIVRRSTWDILLSLIGGKLREKLEEMPDIGLLTTSEHLKAIEERLVIVFATIEYCRTVKKNLHDNL